MMHIKKIVTLGAILLVTWLVQSNVSFAQTTDAVDLNIVVANDNGDSLFTGSISIDSTASTTITTNTGTTTEVADDTLASVIQRASTDSNSNFSNLIFTDSGSLYSLDDSSGTLTGPWNITKNDTVISDNLFTETLAAGDAITIVVGPTIRIDVANSATTAIATLPLNIAVQSFGINTLWANQYEGAVMAVFDGTTIIATSTTAAGTGIAQFRIPTPGNYVVNFADKSGADFPITITTIPSDKVVFRVRGNSNIVFEDALSLPGAGVITLAGQDVDSRSVSAILSILNTTASTTPVFAYASSTVYLDSMSIDGTPATPWLHAINGVISDLVSNEILVGGEDVRFFDAAQFRTTFSTTTVATGTPVEITFEKFDVSDMSKSAYIPDAGIDIGAFASTSSVVAATTTDPDGIASFAFNTPGVYRIGKIADGYENGTEITVLDSSSTTTSTTTDTGGTGTTTPTQTSFVKDLAVNFLVNNNRATSTTEQKEWNAIAFSVVSPDDIHGGPNQTAFNSEKAFLASFLKTGALAGTEPRDVARRILALIAIGENPYTAGSIDRVANLVSMFNGTSFGTGPTTSVTTIDNAYAVLALKNAGYAMSEPMMQTTIASIKSERVSNGSWNNDLNATAVALEALSLESSTSTEAIEAKEYLEQKQNPGNASWATTDETITARVLLSLFAAGVQNSNLTQSGWTPLTHLADQQNGEYSIGKMTTSINELISATALTIIAMTEKSLDTNITDTSKPAVATTSTSTPSTTTSSSGGSRSSQNTSAPATTPSQDVLRFIESRTGLKGNTMVFVGTVSQPQIKTTPATPKKTVIVATAPEQKPTIALSTTTPSTTVGMQNIAGVGAADTRGFFATLGSRMKNGFKMLFGTIFSN